MLSRLSRLIKVLSQPRVITVTPATGTKLGGTVITNLSGSGFEPGAKVYVNDVLCTSIVVVSQVKITCVTPSSPSVGKKSLVVKNPDGESSSLTSGFVYT